MAWRYMAQRALTNEWLHWDVPLNEASITYQLSGPNQLTATIAPEDSSLLASDGRPLFDEWSTIIYAEESGIIRYGGILVPSEFGPDGSWQVEFSGFSGYANGNTYSGDQSWDSVDPLVVVRHIWSHLQSKPDGNLGLVLDDTTSPIRIGKVVKKKNSKDKTEEVNEPYVLGYWEEKDCGDEIDSLAGQTPFDYFEEHAWDGDEVAHRLRLGYPRLGRRRTDLRFVQGENLQLSPSVTRSGDEFCNVVRAVGKGEGRKAKRQEYAVRDGRLRRERVVVDSSISDDDRLKTLARREYMVNNPLPGVSEITVFDHPNAKLGSFVPGDDILIQADLPWLKDFQLWCRITALTITPGSDAMQLSLARSDSFTYAGESSG